MIYADTLLHAKFSLLDAELQSLLLKDLGFLTLKTDFDQLKFVEEILSLSQYQRSVFQEKLSKKQKSDAYLQNWGRFQKAYKKNILPRLNKGIQATQRSEEKYSDNVADDFLDQSLNTIEDG